MYTKTIRPIARKSLNALVPRPLSPQNFVHVVGLPRSGTSWLAKALSLTRGTTYYFEPDINLESQFYYIPGPGRPDAAYLQEFFSEAVAGKVDVKYTLAEMGLRELLLRPFSRNVLIKWVRLAMSTPWLIGDYKSTKVVQIVRHPVPQFLSWKSRGWDPGVELTLLLRSIGRGAGIFEEQAVDIEGRDGADFWENAAFFWSMMATMQLKSHKVNSVLVEHEWLCQKPYERVSRVAQFCDLQMTDSVSEFLSPGRARATGPGYGESRSSAGEIHKWRGSISDKDLAKVMRVTKLFDLPFYQDLDPEAFDESSKSLL